MNKRPLLYTFTASLLLAANAFADSYNVSIVAGENLIANQLDHGSNTLDEVFTGVPDGSTLYKYDNASSTWAVSTYSAVSGSWANGNSITLKPGEGAFLQSPTSFTLTFTGTPHVPVLPVSLASGAYSLLSRQTNGIGNWNNIVGTSPVGSETVFKYNGGYSAYVFDDIDMVWSPSEPIANVGEAMWFRSSGGGAPPVLPLMFDGLPHSPLGSAILATNGLGGLQISNLGSSGQDGVDIALPSALGWEAHWEPLDPTDSLPVSAYVKSEIYGSTGPGSNGFLASWTLTKSGSSTYAVTADFSHLGVSTVTVQVYNGTNLVAETNGQSGALCMVNGCVDDDHWGNPTPSWPPGRFGGGLTFLDPRDMTFPGGWTVQGDRLVILAEGGSSVNALTRTKLVASGIPQITLTEEYHFVQFAGLLHKSLGNASIINIGSSGQDGVSIGNIGSSGQDGVSISLDRARAFEAHWGELDPTDALPVGAYIGDTVIGSLNGQANQVLGSTRVEKSGTTNYLITADFSTLGVSNRTVQVFNGDVLVAQAQVDGNSGEAATARKGRLDIDTGVDDNGIYIDITIKKKAPQTNTTAFVIHGGPTAIGDRLRVRPGMQADYLSEVRLVASGIPQVNLNEEHHFVQFAGLLHKSLGSARISNIGSSGQDGVSIANIGSSGQDGVSFALNRARAFEVHWEDLDPTNAMPVGAYIGDTVIGSFNGQADHVLGSTRVQKIGTTNYLITADFSALGVSNRTVQVFNGDLLVAQVDGQSGAVATARKGRLDLDAGVDDSGIYIDITIRKKAPQTNTAAFVIHGGPTAVGDRLRLRPGKQADYLSEVQLVASGIPQVNLIEEHHSVQFAGLLHTSLGSARVSNIGSSGQDGVSISNLGSSGQDGVSIALNQVQAFEAHWEELDPTDALPVGAYMSNTVFGTLNGLTNQELGSMAMEKVGTSNYLFTADFSPQGSSTRTVQVYNGDTLVATLSGQSGPVATANFGGVSLHVDTETNGTTVTTHYKWDWRRFPTLTLNGGATVVGDLLVVTPESPSQPVSQFSGVQLIASGIPEINLIEEHHSVQFAGLLHKSLGSARIANIGSSGQDGVSISNLGSSGQDGVSIALNQAQAFEAHWENLDPTNALPAGAYLDHTVFGSLNGLANQELGSMRMEKVGTSNYLITADFSPLGASTRTVQVYNNGTLVSTLGGQSGPSVAASIPGHFSFHSERDTNGTLHLKFDWTPSTSVAISGGATVVGDLLVVTPEGSTQPVDYLSGIELLASGIPRVNVTEEHHFVRSAGLLHKSLGSASVANIGSSGQDGVSISNIGSSGQDGVSIALNQVKGFDLDWADLDPLNALPAGAYVDSTVKGLLNGQADHTLGSTRVQKLGTTNYLITADFSAMGATSRKVQVYSNNVLVATVNGQTGTVATALKGIFSLHGSRDDNGTIHIKLDWKPSTQLALNGGPTVFGDLLVMTPEGTVPTVGNLSEVQLLASGISEINVTNETVVALPIVLSTIRSAGDIFIQWQGGGVLQESTDLLIWTDIIGASSPYPVIPTGPRKFYRVRN